MFASKKLLGVTTRTPNMLVIGELNCYPLFIDAKIRALKYWFKVMSMEDNRIPKQAYLRERREVNKQDGWAANIKQLLEINGCAYVWLNQGTMYVNSFVKKFKQCLIDQHWQNWHANLQDSDRCDIYRLIKENHIREHYVQTLLITKFRRAFARFRLGIVDLRNNCRFLKPFSSRFCLFCRPAKIIEDELHFLLHCPNYENIRSKYLERCWITLNNLSLKDIIANDSETVTKYSAMYIHYALRHREETLPR